MATSTRPTPTEPVAGRVTADALTVDLSDGQTTSAPTEWSNFELTYDGVHWPDLNEDVPVEGLLRGERSGESRRSIRRWLDLRHQGRRQPVPQVPLPAEWVAALEPLAVAGPRVTKGRRGRRAG